MQPTNNSSGTRVGPGGIPDHRSFQEPGLPGSGGSEPQVEVVLTTEPLMQDYLRMGGIDNVDVFLALSRDDHHNALVAQIALYIFNVPRVICYLEHPQLRILYAGLGLDVVGSPLGLVQDIRQAIVG